MQPKPQISKNGRRILSSRVLSLSRIIGLTKLANDGVKRTSA